MKKGLVFLAVVLCSLALFANGQTEDSSKGDGKFPSGPITLVVPWKAGGGADLICRMFEKLGIEYFGVPIVVENQDGAAGITATMNFLNAKPDGYSVLFDNGGVFTSKSLTGATGYSIDDFQPLCGIVKDVNILIINKKTTGCSTFEEFTAKYSGTNATFTVGCATGGIPHICMAQLFNEANIKYKQIAYNGASEISAALLGGHIDVATLGGSEIGIVKDAKDIGLLVAFADKTPEIEGLENVPAVSDFGYNIDTSVWRMLLVPKGIPDDVFKVLYDGFTGMIKDPRFVEFAKTNGLAIDIKEPAEVTKAVKAELASMIPIFQELKLGIYSKK